MSDEKKKYSHMENVFQYINKNYVSLDEKISKRNNVILKNITTALINKMMKTDVLFKSMYRTIFYGGSYYDGLKITKPEEYDLDLLLKIPDYAGVTLAVGNVPGFVHLKMTSMERFKKQPEYQTNFNRFLNIFCDDKLYLNTDKVLRWMESVIIKSLSEFPQLQSQFVFEDEGSSYCVKVVKGGPAFTLKVNGGDVHMDIDLVPCFVFGDDKWPPGTFRQNPFKTKKPEFFVVPKSPKNAPTNAKIETYWRLSFQEQERLYMNGLKTLKPTIKLLKKLRDQLNHKCISSYFIKTIFLWEVDKRPQVSFWDQNLSTVYITMLKIYTSHIENKKIPYFWNKRNNLIGNVSTITLDNIGNTLKKIVSEIDKHVADSYIGAKALLPVADFEALKKQVSVNKKHLN